MGHRGGRRDGGLVLAAIETTEIVVDDTLELDDKRSLLGDG
jgi:hypothetical protein